MERLNPEDALEPSMPELAATPEAIRDELLVQLHAAAGRGELKGIALVQGIKALAALVPPPPPAEPEDSKPFSILDQKDALPRKEFQRLLRLEIARRREELAEHEAALITTAETK